MTHLIEITHPRRRTVRVELDERTMSVGLRGERVERVPPGRGNREAMLAFTWRASVDHVTWYSLAKPAFFGGRVDPVIDGRRVNEERGELRAGQRMTWNEFSIEIKPRTELTRAFVEGAEHARTNPGALLVLADDAEAQGELELAEWIRGMETKATGRRTVDAKTFAMRLRALAEPVPARLRAAFARGTIEGCSIRCRGKWEELPVDGADLQSRVCSRCSERVQFLEHTEVYERGPYVLCHSTGRTTDDTRPYGVIG